MEGDRPRSTGLLVMVIYKSDVEGYGEAVAAFQPDKSVVVRFIGATTTLDADWGYDVRAAHEDGPETFEQFICERLCEAGQLVWDDVDLRWMTADDAHEQAQRLEAFYARGKYRVTSDYSYD